MRPLWCYPFRTSDNRVIRLYARKDIEDRIVPNDPTEAIDELQSVWKHWARKCDEQQQQLEAYELEYKAATERLYASRAHCNRKHSDPTADRLVKLSQEEKKQWADDLDGVTTEKDFWRRECIYQTEQNRKLQRRHEKSALEAGVGYQQGIKSLQDEVNNLKHQLEQKQNDLEAQKRELQDVYKKLEVYKPHFDEVEKANSELRHQLGLASKFGVSLTKWKMNAEARESARNRKLATSSLITKSGGDIQSDGAFDGATVPERVTEL